MNIDEAIERLEIDNSDDWVASPQVDSNDVRTVLAEVKRLRAVPVKALEQLRAEYDETTAGWDERMLQGYRAGIANALTVVRAAVRGDAR